jgi:hypothetical protein
MRRARRRRGEGSRNATYVTDASSRVSGTANPSNSIPKSKLLWKQIAINAPSAQLASGPRVHRRIAKTITHNASTPSTIATGIPQSTTVCSGSFSRYGNVAIALAGWTRVNADSNAPRPTPTQGDVSTSSAEDRHAANLLRGSDISVSEVSSSCVTMPLAPM